MTENDALIFVKTNKRGNKQALKELIGAELYQKLRSADIIDSNDTEWYLTPYGYEYMPS